MKFDLFSLTAYEPETGTIGSLELELHFISQALARAGHDVTVFAGTLPGATEEHTVRRFGNITLVRDQQLSPTEQRPHSRYTPLDQRKIHESKQFFERITGDSDVSVAFGLGERIHIAHGLAEAKRGNSTLCHVPFTEYTDQRAYTLPWDWHLYNGGLEKQMSELKGANTPSFVSRTVPNLKRFVATTVPPEDTGIPQIDGFWIYLPPLASLRMPQRRALQAIAHAQRQLDVPITAVITRGERQSEPFPAAGRLTVLQEDAERLGVELRVIPPLEPWQMPAFIRTAPAVSAEYGSVTAREATASKRPVILLNEDHLKTDRSPRRLARDIRVAHRGSDTLALEGGHDEDWRSLLPDHQPDRIAELVTFFERLPNLDPNLLQRAPALGARRSMKYIIDLPQKIRTLGEKLPLDEPPPHLDAKLDAVVVSTTHAYGQLDAAIEIAQRQNCQLVVMCSNALDMQDHAATLELRGIDDAILIDVSSFKNHPIRGLGAQLRGHPYARADHDVDDKRNIATALFQGKRIWYLDEDVWLDKNNPQRNSHSKKSKQSRMSFDNRADVESAVKYIGPNGVNGIGIPVIDEPDLNLFQHTVTQFKLYDHVIKDFRLKAPVPFFGAGSFLGLMGFNARLYGEDWMAQLDDICSGKLATEGQAFQSQSSHFWPSQGGDTEELGDVITNALMAWVLQCKTEGTLHRRSWTEITPEFINDFAQTWKIGLAQTREALTARQLNGEIEGSHEASAACMSLDNQLAELSNLDPNLAVQYIRLFADTADQFHEAIQQLPLLDTLSERINHLGLRSYRTSHQNELRKTANTTFTSRTPPDPQAAFMSERWLGPAFWRPAKSGTSDTVQRVRDELGLGDTDGHRVEAIRQTLERLQSMLFRRPGWQDFAFASRYIAPQGIDLKIGIPNAVMRQARKFEQSHFEKCQAAIRSIHNIEPFRPDNQLRQMLVCSKLISTAQNDVHLRLEAARADPRLSSENIDHRTDLLHETFFRHAGEVPCLEYSITSAQLAMRALERCSSWADELSQPALQSTLLKTAIFRVATSPPSDVQGRAWQDQHRTALLEGVLYEDQLLTAKQLVASANTAGTLGPSLSDVWSNDWTTQIDLPNLDRAQIYQRSLTEQLTLGTPINPALN